MKLSIISSLLLLFSSLLLSRARLWRMELGGGDLRMLELASRIVELLVCLREEATHSGIKVSSLDPGRIEGASAR